MIHQILNVSIITVNSTKGHKIIQDRQTIFHSSLDSNVAARIVKVILEPTLRTKRDKK